MVELIYTYLPLPLQFITLLQVEHLKCTLPVTAKYNVQGASPQNEEFIYSVTDKEQKV